ncbi:hypothetical protein [Caldimonas tepidiphila]|uniref:hypothetical protein n=1 Tax=Caldimonas tepidiphila TaxID=2315841 RepID=UPI000E5B44B7|nr:hypothetical protein [Caldimonas tepidiphila]
MAIGWLSALKVIPWGQVIQHAPDVLQGARRLMERQRGEAPPPPPAPPMARTEGVPPSPGTPGLQEARLAQVEAGLSDLHSRLAAHAEQQRRGDELLAALAEQNASLVEAVDVLRARNRLLLGATAVLAVAVVALAWRVLGG